MTIRWLVLCGVVATLGVGCGGGKPTPPPPTCSCAVHQICASGVCQQSCDSGYAWNASSASCVVAGPALNCTPGAANSLVDQCNALHRVCAEASGTASCTTCLNGYLEASSQCRAVQTCLDLGCAAKNQDCTAPGQHSDAACGACLPGYKLQGGSCVVDITVTCVQLAATCDSKHRNCSEASGSAQCANCKSGFIDDTAAGACRLPYTCATLPTACGVGQQCVEGTAGTDASCANIPCSCSGLAGYDPTVGPKFTAASECVCGTLDGWFYSLTKGQPVKCDADGDGWTKESAAKWMTYFDGAVSDNARCHVKSVDRVAFENVFGQSKEVLLAEPLPLWEIDGNDELNLRQTLLPVYGTGGRALQAREINSLTKACVGLTADVNGNGVADMKEWGRLGVGSTAGDQVSGVTAPSNSGVPLKYFQTYAQLSHFVELNDGWYVGGAPGAYGAYHIREKSRLVGVTGGVPLRYDPTIANPVSDYWQSCPRGRDRWYVEAGGLPIGMDFGSVSGPDAVWQGMNHSSQFKCVQVVSPTTYTATVPDPKLAHQVQSTTVGGTTGTLERMGWQPNACVAQAGSTTPGGQANPASPLITCQPAAAATDTVAWAAVPIQQDAASWERGCIVQCPGYPFLCPPAQPGSASTCYHVCGDFAGSEVKTLTSGTSSGYALRGEVPFPAIEGKTLGDPSTGYSIRTP